MCCCFRSTGFGALCKSYKKFTANDQYIELYNTRIKAQRDEASRLDDALEKGLEQGRKETNLENAMVMLSKGFDAQDIRDITGLTIEEIDMLK
ncbi:MAG: hypothetical protein JEY99_07205 [Spirochaetales bacterium]|nr:hypothetical protein [Spirochaetales bacterium]